METESTARAPMQLTLQSGHLSTMELGPAIQAPAQAHPQPMIVAKWFKKKSQFKPLNVDAQARIKATNDRSFLFKLFGDNCRIQNKGRKAAKKNAKAHGDPNWPGSLSKKIQKAEFVNMSLEERKATTKELLVTLKAKSEAEAQKIADEMDFSWTDTYAEKEKKPRRPKKLKEAGKSLKRKKEKKGKGGENGESGGAGMKRGRDEMEVDEELSIEDYLGERIKKLRI